MTSSIIRTNGLSHSQKMHLANTLRYTRDEISLFLKTRNSLLATSTQTSPHILLLNSLFSFGMTDCLWSLSSNDSDAKTRVIALTHVKVNNGPFQRRGVLRYAIEYMLANLQEFASWDAVCIRTMSKYEITRYISRRVEPVNLDRAATVTKDYDDDDVEDEDEDEDADEDISSHDDVNGTLAFAIKLEDVESIAYDKDIDDYDAESYLSFDEHRRLLLCEYCMRASADIRKLDLFKRCRTLGIAETPMDATLDGRSPASMRLRLNRTMQLIKARVELTKQERSGSALTDLAVRLLDVMDDLTACAKLEDVVEFHENLVVASHLIRSILATKTWRHADSEVIQSNLTFQAEIDDDDNDDLDYHNMTLATCFEAMEDADAIELKKVLINSGEAVKLDPSNYSRHDAVLLADAVSMLNHIWHTFRTSDTMFFP